MVACVPLQFSVDESDMGAAYEFRSTGYLDLPRLQRRCTSANLMPPSFELLLNQGDGSASALRGDCYTVNELTTSMSVWHYKLSWSIGGTHILQMVLSENEGATARHNVKPARIQF